MASGELSDTDTIVQSETKGLTWKRLLDDPGLLSSLFSPTLREPSLILDELAVKGSGAATLDSFYSAQEYCLVSKQQKRS